MKETIRVLIVDDQRLIRDGIRSILDLDEGIMVVGEADCGIQAVENYELCKPHIVLMDVRMPDMDGIEATKIIRSKHPDARIIILTTFDDDEIIYNGLRAGALGFLLKDISANELTKAIYTVANGGALIEPSITEKVLAEFSRMALYSRKQEYQRENQIMITEREREILRLLCKGYSNKQISEQLFLAEGTVKNYLSTIFQKLHVQDRTQAVIRANELGLLL